MKLYKHNIWIYVLCAKTFLVLYNLIIIDKVYKICFVNTRGIYFPLFSSCPFFSRNIVLFKYNRTRGHMSYTWQNNKCIRGTFINLSFACCKNSSYLTLQKLSLRSTAEIYLGWVSWLLRNVGISYEFQTV